MSKIYIYMSHIVTSALNSIWPILVDVDRGAATLDLALAWRPLIMKQAKIRNLEAV